MKIRLLLLSVLLFFLLGSCERTTPDPEPASCDHKWPENYSVIEPTVEEDGARHKIIVDISNYFFFSPSHSWMS